MIGCEAVGHVCEACKENFVFSHKEVTTLPTCWYTVVFLSASPLVRPELRGHQHIVSIEGPK